MIAGESCVFCGYEVLFENCLVFVISMIIVLRKMGTLRMFDWNAWNSNETSTSDYARFDANHDLSTRAEFAAS